MDKYIIIEDDDADRLADRVQKLMYEGWVCQGGIAATVYVTTSCVYKRYYQAMVLIRK